MDKGKECRASVLTLEEAMQESVPKTVDMDDISAPIEADFWIHSQREYEELQSKRFAREHQVTKWAQWVASRVAAVTKRVHVSGDALSLWSAKLEESRAALDSQIADR